MSKNVENRSVFRHNVYEVVNRQEDFMNYLARGALQHLNDWHIKASRKPLVIRGARQVGKTELVRQFAAVNGLDLVEVNLEESFISEFDQDSFDVDRCLNEIMAVANKKLKSNSLVFIDEIQESQKAYSRLRFFKEKKPELPVIAAGSLLEVVLRQLKLKAPVGRVEYLYIGPFTFDEFLKARGKNVLAEFVDQFRQGDFAALTESIHNELVKQLTDFFFVGGMPEAIVAFNQSNGSYVAARELQQHLLQSYHEDIERYASGKQGEVLHDVLNSLPYEIGKKTIYSRLSRAKTPYIKEALDIFEGIFLAQKVFHSNCSGLPLSKTGDRNVFKTFFLDVGLYNCLMGLKWSELAELSPDLLLSKGDMAEQFAAQHLYLDSFKTQKTNTYYWLRDKVPENAEVDFVLPMDNKVVPVEIKSGKAGSLKSLIRFMGEHQKVTDQAIRYDLKFRTQLEETVSYRWQGSHESVTFRLKSLPLYCI